MRLWNERGFENVSVVDICEAADITQSAFFHHVKSMTELGVSALAAILPLRTFANELILFQGTTHEFLDKAFGLVSERLAGHDPLLLAMMRKQLGHDAVWVDDDGVVQIVRWAIARGKARGEIDPSIPTEVATTTFLAIMVGSATQSQALGHDLDTTIEAIVRRARWTLDWYQPQPRFDEPPAVGLADDGGDDG
jgi:AcrR family transcriptional regulator